MKLAALITRGTHKYELAYVTGNKKTVTEAGSKNWRFRGVNASCFINGPYREVLISKDSQGK